MAEAGSAESTTGRRRARRRARSSLGVLCAFVVLGAGACGTAPDPTDGPSAAVATVTGVEDDATVTADTGTAGPAPASDDEGPAAEAGDTTVPTERSAVRSVVEGFPVDLLPLPEDAMILVTSAVPVGDSEAQEVSLNLRTRATPAEVLELYRASLTSAGFTELPTDAPHDELAAEATFIRSGGDELVSVGVLDDDGLRSVTIGGRLRTQE
ncbi:hypothetical protein GXB85_03470 [Cellulomonas sp. APG4]|uniref:hypothetical protein n=1 Tax=Cellulomonas sp. APG4 TaxID=1538656 RepID=UPI00137B5EE3|nr:hypothetical protein [Cellulomonas sp. APG4]NCT90016.1 hypothetical protein [Cellulomonas sp. APG4]